MRFLLAFVACSLLAAGCNTGAGGAGGGIAGIYGGGGSGGGGGSAGGGDQMDTGGQSDTGSTKSQITFSPTSGFPQGESPATFEIAGGSITTTGGIAGTLGQTGLYADDEFAWDFLPGATGRITFDGLEVTAVDGYWVHPDSQAGGATMTVNFSGGGSAIVDSAPVDALGASGQEGGFFDTVTAPEGETITGLTFAFAEGASPDDVAALDVLELTLAE